MRQRRFPRPTIRCLEELGYTKLPPATEPLDMLPDPILAKAREVMEAAPAGVERIVELDDRVFWKVKIDRWRGALWTPSDEGWLAAAGYRRQGDADDFYRELGTTARRRRAEHNRSHSPPLTTDGCTDHLLPTGDDRDRLVLEDALRVVDDLRIEVADLTRQSASNGIEAPGEAAGCELGVLVRRGELGEVYIAVRIVARTPDQVEDIYALVLDAVPAVADREGWFIDDMPGRSTVPGEVVWSNVLDEEELDHFLGGA